MSSATLERLIWVLIYGGLLALGLGLSIARSDVPVGSAVAIVGGVVAAVGALLILVRSRMKSR